MKDSSKNKHYSKMSLEVAVEKPTAPFRRRIQVELNRKPYQ